jgi:hypothetical protein
MIIKKGCRTWKQEHEVAGTARNDPGSGLR